MTTQTVTLRLVAENGQLVGTVRSTKAEIEGLGTGAQKAGVAAEKGFAQASRGAERTSTFITRAKQAAAGFVLAFASVQGAQAATQIADRYANVTAQLKLATDGQKQYAIAEEQVFAVAQRTSTALSSTADLYARITRSTADLGIQQFRILELTETINQTFAVSGTAATNQANAITQLTQAFAGGVLRAEEFNSVIENSPRLAQALADGLDVGIGRLRAMVNEGEITVDRIISALQDQARQIAAEFASMPLTIERAWQQIGNAVLSYVGQADQARGTSAAVAEAISLVAQNFDVLADAVIRGTTVAAAYFALFVAAPALYAAAAGALVTYRNAVVSVTLAKEMGIAVAWTWASAMQAAAGLAIAAFAGWQLGTWLRDNFLAAELAGIAFVEGSLVGWERLKQGAAVAWAGIQSAALGALNVIRTGLANLVSRAASMAEATDIFGIGDGAIARLRELEDELRPTTSAADQFAASVAEINAQADRNVASVRAITSDMADYAIESHAARGAVAGMGNAAATASTQVQGLATDTDAAKTASEAAAKAWQDYQDTLAKRADAYDEALFSVQDEIAYQTELNRLLRDGVAEVQAEAQARRAMEPIQSNALNAERDRLAALQASNAAIVQGREAQAEASRKAQDQARETAQASQRAAADINRSLTDALLRGFEDGRNIADNFFATLKNTAAALVLRPVIQFVLSPLSSVLGSIAGGGGGGLLSSLTGGGGGGLGQLASLFGGGVSLAQGATLGFQGGGVLGAAQGFADAALTNLGEGIANLGARFGSASAQSFGSSISASAGSLGNVLGAAGLGYLGGSTVAQLIGLDGSGQTGAGIGGALGAGIGSIVPGLGTLLGGALGTALGGLVGSAFGGGSWGQDDLRLRGSFVGDEFGDASLTQYVSRKQSFGRGRRRRQNELDPTGFADALSDLFGNVFDAGTAAAERLGLSITDFTYSIDESLNGLEGADLEARIVEIIGGASDALAEQLLPSLDRYRREGESSADTFFRLADSAIRMQDALTTVNQAMNVTGQDLVMVSQVLLDQFGGSLEAFEAATAAFFDRFYSDAEKFARDQQTLTDAFGGIDISGLDYELPDTREAFRDFVEGLNLTLTTGAEAYAILTSLSEVADRYYGTLEQREADRADLLGSINDRIDDLTMSAEALDLRDLDRDIDALRERAEALDLDTTLIDQLYALEIAARQAAEATEDLAARHAFDSDIAGRLARQGLSGRGLESFNLEAEYTEAMDEARRLGADLTAVEAFFQGERNRIAREAADEALADERDAAEAIAAEKSGLLRELYQLQGDTLSLRAMERAALDAANQPLYDRIQALRDSQAAEQAAAAATEARTAAAAQAVEAARRVAVATYDAEIERLQAVVGAVSEARSRVDAARSNAVSIYQRERAEIEATAEEFRSLAASIGDFRAGLRGELRGPQAAAASAQQAFEAVARRARLGDRSALAQFPDAARSAQASALATAATRQDYLDQLAAIDSAAAEAESVAQRQASIAEDQLRHLDATAARLGLLNEQVETLDGAVRTLQSAEAALAAAEIAAEQAELQIEELQAARDQLAEVNTSVLSVGAAVAQLAVAQAQYAASIASGFGSLQSQISGLAAAQAAQAARDRQVPGFASGGDHFGGLRIVGERGPELELTGPARILNAEQTRAILAGAGSGGGGDTAALARRLDALIEQQARILRILTTLGINSDRLDAVVEDWDANGLPQERVA